MSEPGKGVTVTGFEESGISTDLILMWLTECQHGIDQDLDLAT